MYSPLEWMAAGIAVQFQDKKLFKSVDLLGKTIVPESNKPFLNIYKDGTVERKVIVE